jgi:hypothetical protein
VNNSAKRVSLALLAAAVVPAMTAGLLSSIDQLGPSESKIKYMLSIALIAFLVALAHAIVLGLPTYFVLNKLHLMRWWISIICGFVIGTLPLTIEYWRTTVSLVRPPMDEVNNGVYLVRNGVLTTAWWSQTILENSVFGIFGMLGAFSAWLVWRYFPGAPTLE